MSTYFCTGCGEPQPATATFCSNCGETIDPNDVARSRAGRPSVTVRLPDAAAFGGPTVAVAGNMPGASGSTVPGSSRRLRLPQVGLNRNMLALGTVLLTLVLVGGLVFTYGLPFGTGQAKSVDRVVTLTTGRNGATTLVLMRGDGTNKRTLVDDSGPGESTGGTSSTGSPQWLSVEYASRTSDVDFFGRQGSYGPQGATILANQQRIVFWYVGRDGTEIRSVDLDGGNEVSLAQASLATQLIIPEHGNHLLLIENDQGSQRLSLIDLSGKATPLVENALNVGATISPDGAHIAYWQSDDDQRYTLTVANGSGANPIDVGNDLTQVSAQYSADSSKLFINRSDEQESSFQVADTNGQNIVTLDRTSTHGTGQVAQGRLVYETTDNGATSLFSTDLNGDDPVEIVRAVDGLRWRFTQDRKQLLLMQQRNNRTTLQISDLKHEQVQELKRGDGWINGQELDNGRIFIWRSSGDNHDLTFSTIMPDGSEEQVLKRDVVAYSIKVQGNNILLSGTDNEQAVLYLLGGEDPVLLDDEADRYSEAHFAPDGRIIYTAQFKSGPVTYIINRDGKQRKLLADDAAITATGF